VLFITKNHHDSELSVIREYQWHWWWERIHCSIILNATGFTIGANPKGVHEAWKQFVQSSVLYLDIVGAQQGHVLFL
jgi:hypothetical protein